MIHYGVNSSVEMVMRHALTSLAEGDLERFVSYFQPEAELHAHFGTPLPMGGVVRGHVELLEHYRNRIELTPVMSQHWSIRLVSGEDYVLYGVYGYGRVGTRELADANAAAWFTVRNECIVDAHSYVDSSGIWSLLQSGEKMSLREATKQHGFLAAIRSSIYASGELTGDPREDFSSLMQLYESRERLCRSDLLDLVDPKAQWFSPSTVSLDLPCRACGIDEISRHFRVFDAAFETLDLQIHRIIQAEDTIAIRANLLLSCRSCGIELNLPSFQALTMRQGRIVRGFEVADTLKLDVCGKCFCS
ncbi:nuclear transport factor 2 family protein [bacterium]|nr:nuclear transport factor 2 family protein [bacterium]